MSTGEITKSENGVWENVSMSTTTTAPSREVVTGDELRVGDLLCTNGPNLYINKIEEKPKTRVLLLEDTVTCFEQPYRIRRSTQVYIVPRKAYEARAMVDSWGPCINDSMLVRDLDEGREWAERWLARGPDETEYVEIVEVELPGPMHGDFAYVPDGEYVRIERD